MRIINFGSCNIDYVYFLDHIVKPGETQATYMLETFAGGKGLNQSIAVGDWQGGLTAADRAGHRKRWGVGLSGAGGARKRKDKSKDLSFLFQ